MIFVDGQTTSVLDCSLRSTGLIGILHFEVFVAREIDSLIGSIATELERSQSAAYQTRGDRRRLHRHGRASAELNYEEGETKIASAAHRRIERRTKANGLDPASRRSHMHCTGSQTFLLPIPELHRLGSVHELAVRSRSAGLSRNIIEFVRNALLVYVNEHA